VSAKQSALVGLKGQEIYTKPRGVLAGYNWPQYAAHRGEFHMTLDRRFIDLSGADAVGTGHRAQSYGH